MTANEPLSYDPAGSIDVILSVVPTMSGCPAASPPPDEDVPPPPPAQPARRSAEAPKAPSARPRRPRLLWCSDIWCYLCCERVGRVQVTRPSGYPHPAPAKGQSSERFVTRLKPGHRGTGCRPGRAGSAFRAESERLELGLGEHPGPDDEAVPGRALDAETRPSARHDIDREVGVLPVLELGLRDEDVDRTVQPDVEHPEMDVARTGQEHADGVAHRRAAVAASARLVEHERPVLRREFAQQGGRGIR